MLGWSIYILTSPIKKIYTFTTPMRKKLLIAYVFLFSYAGAVAHSIVPHHHHQSQGEAKEHHHHGHSNVPPDDSSKNDKGDDGQLYFLSHTSNADVVVNHVSIDNLVIGNVQFAGLLPESIITFTIADHNIFHPPMDDRIPLITVFYSRSLRAPPSFII